MLSINKCIVLLTLALSAVAASHGQNMARINHRDVAARAPIAAPETAPIGVIQKRASNASRCKARTTSLTSSKPTSTSSSTSTSTSIKHTPTSTSSKYTPTSTKHTSTPTPEKTTTSKAAAPTSGLTTGGVATYFMQDGTTGACGAKHPDSSLMCALETKLYSNGDNCGKSVEITNLKNGKTITVIVADECPGCDNAASIDLFQGAFEALGGTVSEGEFPIAFKII